MILGSLIFIFLTSSSVTTFIILRNVRWPFKYIVFENISGGGYVPTRRGRCRIVTIADTGEEIFFLKGLNKYKVAYGKRIGQKYISWTVGADGYWYNNSFEDFDVKLRKLGINPVDKNVRMAYASVRKLINNRYDKKSFMDKYGTIIAFGMLFLCIGAMIGFIWVLSNKQSKISETNLEALKVQKDVQEATAKIINQIEILQAGGRGYIQAPTPVT